MQLTWMFLALSIVAAGGQADGVRYHSTALAFRSLNVERAAAAGAWRPVTFERRPEQSPGRATAKTVVSRFRLIMPHPDAELQFDGRETKTTGLNRDWETPPLEPNRTYKAIFTVKWRPNNYTALTRTKVVTFSSGDPVFVDLSRDDAADRAEIRYVPTPDHVVAEMIKAAGVTGDDVVYEPGCGDARITIAAVKSGARRGVGIDIDHTRVAESRKRVSAAGLENQIEIRQGDALDIKDLSEATVVFLYMGEEFDMLLRPILWKQLKVGARVVSHRFRMGDWTPDETITVGQPGEDEIWLVHRWTITEEVKAQAANQ